MTGVQTRQASARRRAYRALFGRVVAFAPGEMLFVVALLLLAAALRFTGITFGQPDPAYTPSDAAAGLLPLETPMHPDEYFFVGIPMQMAVSRYPNPKFYESPSFTINVNFITFLLTGSGSQIDPATLPMVGQRRIAPFPAYVVGRVHIALAGILTVAAVYATARWLGGRYAAAAAGLLAAVSVTLVQHSHYALPSMDATAWAAICAWASVAALHQRRPGGWLFALAGAAAGLAATSRYNAAGVSLLVFFVGLVLLYRHRSAWTLRLILIGWLMFPLLFVLGTPGVLFDFPQFWQDFSHITNQFMTTGVGFSQSYLTDSRLSLTFHLRYLAGISLGPTATIAAALGVFAAWRNRPPGRPFSPRNAAWLFTVMLLVYLVVYALVVLRNRRPSYNDHMLLPIVPHLALLAGLGAAWLRERLALPKQVSGPLIVAALIAPTLLMALQFDVLINQRDTRYRMQAWVYEHLPRGAHVHLSAPYNVPLDPADYVTTQTYIDDFTPPDALREQGADYVILSDAWLHEISRSAGFMPPAFVRQVQGYFASFDAGLTRVAAIDRPDWFGADWIMHTASYYHHPGLRVYCLSEESCQAVR